MDSVRAVVETAREIGIRYLTLYAFSTENWQRPSPEVRGLMGLLKSYLQAELDTMLRNDIRLQTIGQRHRLPADVQHILTSTMARTASCQAMVLTLALSYGGRNELARAVQALVSEVLDGHLLPEEIDEEAIGSHLDTVGQPDPDLLIRTGGEHRLSNFLLWQASYAELVFTDIKWPDFRKEEFLDAIAVYGRRQRRYGRTGAQIRPH